MDTAIFLASIFNGTSSGLITISSSILTAPVLMSFLVVAVLATTYSLFIAGTTSAIHPSLSINRKLIYSFWYFVYHPYSGKAYIESSVCIDQE